MDDVYSEENRPTPTKEAKNTGSMTKRMRKHKT